ncbi:MAG: AAA family ATPase, partial [Oscillospiraceae bacterium]|nr:AAA family ATPase [Oscillospiraceae bacterium]
MLQSLTLTDFRNYGSCAAHFSPQVNIIRGRNAQGKTNLLEAVYLVSTGRSFKGARDRDIVRFGCGFARVLGTARGEDGRESQLELRLF